ncbi:MAG: PQQ-binding-like beta-propeller repeat protein [Verrucomicrobia bacterium]|nr:PQQ-binding-like beta-propeller repeat protein [Verrucomicrobiota bacterium]
MKRNLFCPFLCASLIAGAWIPRACAADQPQWGEAWSRNMVSKERGLPESFDPRTGRNIKWAVKLGTQSHSTPIIAGGRIYIGTNNDEPRDPKHQGDRGVFMCLEEKTGRLLWQLVVPKRDEDAFMDWPKMGMSSTATVEGERVYLVDNRGAVLCLDAKGMADGNNGPFLDEAAYMTPPSTNGTSRQQIGAETRPETLHPPADGKLLQPGPLDADILWKFDMVAETGVWPHDAAHSSILIHGDKLYLNTASGVDNTHKRVRAPDAPSLVVLDKKTGRLLARDDEHIAPNVFHNSWAGPSLGRVNGRELVFFCGGNGVVYAFEPLRANPPPGEVFKLKRVFQFDFDPAAPKTDVHKFSTNRRESPSNLYGMPVFHRNRLYVAGGGDIWWGKNEAWLKCIDAARTGDITTNGLVWSYPLQKHVLGTPAVQDDLVFIADCGRTFHCVDAKTGRPNWTHEIKGEVWASPYIADGKVYLGTRSGNFYIFAASKEKKVLAELELGNPISATTTAANGVLYVATMTDLFAVKSDGQ